jgi:DNA polymerase-3 subunit chi
MGEAWFYHLTRSPLEGFLPTLIQRSLAQGWRVELRGRDRERMAWIDTALWAGSREDFLPHGLEGGPHDDLQPVLLTTGPGAGDFGCLITVDGATLVAEEMTRLARCCVLFDGNDAAAVNHARDQWRLVTEAGIWAKYWAEESGRWTMKRERPPNA